MNLLGYFLRVLTGDVRGLDKANLLEYLKRETRTLVKKGKIPKSEKLKMLDGTCCLLRLFACS